jgi:hypothetical protein
MSARPGPRGGYHVSGIPTAIVLTTQSGGLVLGNYTFLTLRFTMQRSNVYAVPKDHILKGFSNSPKTISNSNRRFTAGHRWVLGFLHKRKVRPAASTSSRTQAAISPSGTSSPRRRLRLLRNPGRFTDSKAVQFRWRLRFCGRKSDGRCWTAQCPLFLILHSIALLNIARPSPHPRAACLPR